MNNGYSYIGLINPKNACNVGSAMRAVGVYSSKGLIYTGKRFKKSKRAITDTQKVYRNIPMFNVSDIRKHIPIDCVPVAVDLGIGAENIINYTHPKRAIYIFGPEDGTLGKSILSFCRDKIFIPTDGCMNLAATVNVVLFDRMSKQGLI